MKTEKILTNFTIIYFILGLFFATMFAIYYRWVALSFLSPGFYAVVITWPFQFPGLLKDFITYGFAGKPI